MWLISFCITDDNGDEDRAEDIVDHSEDSTAGSDDLLLNSDGSPDRSGALNLVNYFICVVINKMYTLVP